MRSLSGIGIALGIWGTIDPETLIVALGTAVTIINVLIEFLKWYSSRGKNETDKSNDKNASHD